MNVFRRSTASILASTGCSFSGDWMWRLDDFDIETAAERNHVRYDDATVGGIVVGRERFGELLQAEGCEDGEEVDFVREVEVEELVCWEGGLHAIESHCDLLARPASSN